MEPNPDTIVALSSGSLPSGVAVIRISGTGVLSILKKFTNFVPRPRQASLQKIFDPQSRECIDEGLLLFFKGPQSFTGEDCLEFQVHGGRAVVSTLINILIQEDNVRLAEAGEFSRRAFENGKLDLTEIEGIADLVAAETEMQRKQALQQSQGELREIYEGWRTRLVHLRAMVEAELDFSEEEDVPTDISEAGLKRVSGIIHEIEMHLDDASAGEIIRDGFKIALMGKPNSGKSSLLNLLAKRDVAIVTDQAGTTRDIIQVDMDLKGYAVSLFDTAGIRQTDNAIEKEGIKRAEATAANADLIIWLNDIEDNDYEIPVIEENKIVLISKDDHGKLLENSFSSITGYGIDKLLEVITRQIEIKTQGRPSGLITRKRYRVALVECLGYLRDCLEASPEQIELRAEYLRLAGDCLGKITGRIDVEDLLDVIFAEFCVGK